ncbi:molybdate ABC transporter substrate-binding protein [Anaeromyxobacter diazotrophicus]|uniref:Molybdate ABC transporter substrate-binding protein n=1 Tax=Anaeromyxobacter diazotrophicus TaxID=2590199 RepID=A0A7I9VJU9_9BACT|nr:molybdate ABC transporter substrate-binding protein [Anaeromyxobacter diazotrophicus]GEJ56458.1 molybdate ABC transporter substrate-binding protein [Anaeromyxobacter diazotrophicus]
MLAPAAALLALLAAAPAGGAPALAVAAAANLRPALEELAAAFQARHPGGAVRATYGGSGLLVTQIASGAPFDLFLSADAAYPAELAARGLADAPFTYAVGELVVWVPAGAPIELERRGLAALSDPRVERIALPNPETAPYGRAAREALAAAGLWDGLRPRLVLGQSVAQAASFAASGNAQAAFLPRSLAGAPPLAQAGRSWPVPASSHAPILQAGAVLKAARDPAQARAFAAFLLSDEGRAVLARHGYRAPPR